MDVIMILVPTRHNRKVAERLEDQIFRSYEEIDEATPEDAEYFERLEDFTDACNNDEINFNNYWITYCYLRN